MARENPEQLFRKTNVMACFRRKIADQNPTNDNATLKNKKLEPK